LSINNRITSRGESGYIVEEDINGTIDTISINNIIEKYNIKQIDLLKLDIEGSEKKIFDSDYEL
jgi:FkbM family methyltransferase